MEFVDSLFHQCCHLFEIRTIGHTEWNDGQNITVVACQVLVIVLKQLRVLEGDDFAIERFYHGRGVADAFYLSHGAIDLYPVACLDASRHERGTIVDVLDDVLRGKTDTCGETA